jgi:hypothetical protein
MHGGARPGGGRKPGVPNRQTAELQEAVAASGETPLDYILRVMRDVLTDDPWGLDIPRTLAQPSSAAADGGERSHDAEVWLTRIVAKLMPTAH